MARPTVSVDAPKRWERRGMSGAIMNAWKNTRNVATARSRKRRSLWVSERRC
jgi:hypothetical protein